MLVFVWKLRVKKIVFFLLQKVVFQSDLYHPVIDLNTNELNLNDAFPVWNKSEQHIWQILKYIHWIFYNFTSSISHGINKEAIEL